ncbi:MAG: CHAP domain-containing protein [Actinobacteria bacterium]|nr:CHAP domain-containing protein [Actinomycetota bacterium]
MRGTAMRRLMTLVLLLSGIAVGVSSSVRVAPATAQTNCGTVLLSGTKWLQGGGVDDHSNGANQFTGVSCGGVSITKPPLQYGYGWQCVEIAARLYRLMNWGRVYANGGVKAGNYRYGAQYLPEGSPSLRFYPVTSSYAPVPGDLIIEAGLTYGHVSIVDHTEKSLDGSTQIIAVEQNASMTGFHIYQRGPGVMTGGYHPIKGFLHSPLNTHVEKGGARRGFITTLVSPSGSLFREGTFGVVSSLETVAPNTSPVSAPTVRGSYALSFVDRSQHVWYVDGQGRRFDTGVVAAAKSNPSLQLNANDNPTIAITNTARSLTVWRPSGIVKISSAVHAGSSPALALDARGDYHIAFVTPSHSVSVATANGVVDTGLVAAAYSNAAIAIRGDATTVVVVANSTGIVQSADGSADGTIFTPSAAFVVSVLPGTSPAVVAFGPTGYQVAYVNAQGQMRTFGPLGPLAVTVRSSTLMSSPSLAIRSDGMMVLSATGADGHPWRFTKLTATKSSLIVKSSTAPSTLLLR